MAKLLTRKKTPVESTAAGGQQAVSDNAQSTTTPRYETIAKLAYQLWLERGCPVGQPEEDWFRAEQAVNAGAEPSSSRKQSAPATMGAGSAS